MCFIQNARILSFSGTDGLCFLCKERNIPAPERLFRHAIWALSLAHKAFPVRRKRLFCSAESCLRGCGVYNLLMFNMLCCWPKNCAEVVCRMSVCFCTILSHLTLSVYSFPFIHITRIRYFVSSTGESSFLYVFSDGYCLLLCDKRMLFFLGYD